MGKEDLLAVPIVLASTSPRRSDLLKQMGLEFFVESPNVREIRKKGESPREMVRRLAHEKAASLEEASLRRFGAALIIAADTIVIAPDGKRVLGKPRSVLEAKKMLALLSGKTHTVYTAYCVLAVSRGILSGGDRRRILRVVSSRVRIRKLSREDIVNYVATGEPMDKAGSYAAQGLGMALIESIVGSYTNVVGLPVSHLLGDLEDQFGLPLFALKGNANAKRLDLLG
ncbi:Maf family protein [Bdellovibrionota bacterium FG-2]